MGGVGRAFGKLMLFGEHAAVYGHPAVGASLPESLAARLHGKSAAEWDLHEVDEPDRAPVRGVLSRLEASVPGFMGAARCSVVIESTVPRGAGFGSSAALCGALALAAMEHAGITRQGAERRDAWHHAHDAERLFHGTPSGVDTGLSLLGGLLAFRPRPPALPSNRGIAGNIQGKRRFTHAGTAGNDYQVGTLKSTGNIIQCIKTGHYFL